MFAAAAHHFCSQKLSNAPLSFLLGPLLVLNHLKMHVDTTTGFHCPASGQRATACRRRQPPAPGSIFWPLARLISCCIMSLLIEISIFMEMAKQFVASAA